MTVINSELFFLIKNKYKSTNLSHFVFVQLKWPLGRYCTDIGRNIIILSCFPVLVHNTVTTCCYDAAP